MPAYITHYMFGKRVLERLGSDVCDQEQANAFYIGNQGPDPLGNVKFLSQIDS